MKIHAFTAQHTFVYRMVFVSFNSDALMDIFIDHNATTHPAITAGSRFVRRYVFFCFQMIGLYNRFFRAVYLLGVSTRSSISAVFCAIMVLKMNTATPIPRIIKPSKVKALV